MKLPVIKQLVEQHNLAELKAAEEAILEDKPLNINVIGDDEGEQLTHILASIWIKEQMEEQSLDYKTALREYSKRVRTSIS